MSAGGAPPGWYPDPGGAGQRYFDGNVWTVHVAPWLPPAPYGPASYGPGAGAWWGEPPWKGARYGLPQWGPGSLADPGRRLGARVIDGLLFLPVALACVAVAIALVAPHAGRIIPPQNADPNSTGPTPGIVWLYLAAFAGAFVGSALFVVYETVATARYGRTFGKRWMKIRPVTVDGHALGWGRALGRSTVQSFAGLLSWIGLLDPLWCLWDPDRQCLHDKIVGTLVVND